jgi:hypothetical protein
MVADRTKGPNSLYFEQQYEKTQQSTRAATPLTADSSFVGSLLITEIRDIVRLR